MSFRYSALVRLVLGASPILAAIGCGGDAGGDADGGAGTTSGGTASGVPGVGGGAATGGSYGSGGAASSSGGALGSTGGASSSGGAVGTGGGTAVDRCAAAGLTWKTGNKTNYTSYPDPGSEECIEYNGCTWAGQFAGCNGKKTEEWVAAHDIAALFPGFATYELHDICIKSGSKTMVVTVYDTCGDSDCNGCCTQNKGNKDALIDLESYTNARWGLADGAIEWADLGPTVGDGCD